MERWLFADKNFALDFVRHGVADPECRSFLLQAIENIRCAVEQAEGDGLPRIHQHDRDKTIGMYVIELIMWSSSEHSEMSEGFAEQRKAQHWSVVRRWLHEGY